MSSMQWKGMVLLTDKFFLIYQGKNFPLYTSALYHLLFVQVFEAEKMNTKRGLYHKKCFSCIKCKTNVGYFNAIEGPDDEVKFINKVIENSERD